MSEDPDKIQHSIQVTQIENNDDLRSLLKAANYNAKFAYDHKGGEIYEEVTAPLM